MTNNQPIGLYIHIPFCLQKCAYCDFYSTSNIKGIEQYVNALLSELELRINEIDSPYNTYRNSGLPPAPIANVGQKAIGAVLKPADTNFLFFVADGKGGHVFSKTYDEHKKNHNAWRKIKRLQN